MHWERELPASKLRRTRARQKHPTVCAGKKRVNSRKIRQNKIKSQGICQESENKEEASLTKGPGKKVRNKAGLRSWRHKTSSRSEA